MRFLTCRQDHTKRNSVAEVCRSHVRADACGYGSICLRRLRGCSKTSCMILFRHIAPLRSCMCWKYCLLCRPALVLGCTMATPLDGRESATGAPVDSYCVQHAYQYGILTCHLTRVGSISVLASACQVKSDGALERRLKAKDARS